MNNKSQQQGFTIVELLVVSALILVITGLVIANIKEGEKIRNVKLTADSIESALRQVQNKTLSGQTHPSGSPARAFGFQVTGSQNYYETFVEQAGPTNKVILEKVDFLSNIAITNLIVGGAAASSLEVRFFPPFGGIRISGGAFSEQTDISANFNLIYSGTTRSRTITIDGLSGKISVQ